jgi:HD-GYP domain-containing protein (c-di-GMP phosphodiesterase class II)
LDLVEGQSMGHAVRTCLLAMELGKRLGLPELQLSNVYFAALLKDAGCSANSVRIQAAFGDDHAAKHAVKLIDWSRKSDCLMYGLKNTYPGMPPLKRLIKLVEAANDKENAMDAVTAARCNRGSQIALMLGFGQEVAEAIRALDEHWDGNGAPSHMKGEEIPIVARILCLCQTLEVLASCLTKEGAFKVIRKRTGRWFDPQVAEVAMSLEHDEQLWQDMAGDFRGAVMRISSPAVDLNANATTVDQVCEAFASIIDAKSAFTGEHSKRVTQYARRTRPDARL